MKNKYHSFNYDIKAAPLNVQKSGFSYNDGISLKNKLNNKKLKTIARTKLVDYPVVDKTPARTEVL